VNYSVTFCYSVLAKIYRRGAGKVPELSSGQGLLLNMFLLKGVVTYKGIVSCLEGGAIFL